MAEYEKIKAEALSDDQLDQISGGDNGDTDWETEHDTPLYHVGDKVRVYDTPLHIGSTEATVIRVDEWYVLGPGEKNQWHYTVQYEHGKTKQVTADGIKRK